MTDQTTPDLCPWGCKSKHGLTKGSRDIHGDLNQNYAVWCDHARITAADRERAVEIWNTRLAPAVTVKPLLVRLSNELGASGWHDAGEYLASDYIEGVASRILSAIQPEAEIEGEDRAKALIEKPAPAPTPPTVQEAAKVLLDGIDATWNRSLSVDTNNARMKAERNGHKYSVIDREGFKAVLRTLSEQPPAPTHGE